MTSLFSIDEILVELRICFRSSSEFAMTKIRKTV